MPETKRKRSSPYGISRQTSAILRLRELLVSGEFLTGSRLPEARIAQRIGVSRTPLRLALAALAQEGLVEENPTGGFVVGGLRLSDIYESIEMRGTLEGMALRMALERGYFRDLSLQRELRQPLIAIDRAIKDVSAAPAEALDVYMTNNQRFHLLLLAPMTDSVIFRELSRIMKLPFASPSSGFIRAQIELKHSQEALHMGQSQHYAIIDAIERNEAARAEMLMREHSRIARANLEIALRGGFPDSIPGLHLIRHGEAQHEKRMARPKPSSASN